MIPVKTITPRACFIITIVVFVELLLLLTWTTRETLIALQAKTTTQETHLHDEQRQVTQHKDTGANQMPQQFVLPRPDCSKKLLVYECDSSSRVCSGFADRQKGMMSSFLLALLTGRTFVLKHTVPCALSKYLVPNLYDWQKCLPQTETFDDRYYIEHIDGENNLPDLGSLEKGDIWNERRVFMTTNAILTPDIRRHANVHDTVPWVFMNNWFVFHLVMNVLFKPSQIIGDFVDSFISNITDYGSKQLIGLHIRREFISEAQIYDVFGAIGAYTNNSKFTIYVSTDDENVRRRAVQELSNAVSLNITGIQVHVNHGGSNCDTLKYAVIEQIILGRSRILYKTRSGFSLSAAAMSGRVEKMYQFHKVDGKLVPRLMHLDFPKLDRPLLV